MPAAEPAANQRKFLRVKAVFPRDAGWAEGASRVVSVRVTFQVYGVVAPLHRDGDGWYLKREQEATAFSPTRFFLRERCFVTLGKAEGT